MEPRPHHRQIIDAWTRLTWGNNPKVVSTIDRPPAQLLARLRAVHRHARHRHTHQHPRLSTTALASSPPNATAGVSGSAADHAGHRHGPHRSHRHRLHRPVSTRTRQGRTSRSPPAPTTFCSSCTTSPTPTSCTTAKPSLQHVYDAHYEGAATAQPTPHAGKLSKASSTTSATTRR